ncbi:MAG: tetratricopeptide repeat protein [Cyanobacteria bacterium]|nr:tetratricopeptide repeat protein [Cyanobacteriota bacterium]
MLEIPFDASYHFDDDLHDIPNNPTEMRQALTFLQSQLDDDTIDLKYRIQLLGLIGGYARILKDFSIAQQALDSAIDLSELIGDMRLRTANLIRLAHVYQWQQDYRISEELFEAAIASCQQNSDLESYLDFAYQHVGKCKFDQQQYEAAQHYFEQAMSLRISKADQSLIDSTQIAIDAVKRRRVSAG